MVQAKTKVKPTSQEPRKPLATKAPRQREDNKRPLETPEEPAKKETKLNKEQFKALRKIYFKIEDQRQRLKILTMNEPDDELQACLSKLEETTLLVGRQYHRAAQYQENSDDSESD